MKLFRYGNTNNEKPGVYFENDKYADVSLFGEDYDEQFFGANGIIRLQNWISNNADKVEYIPKPDRFGPPLCRPSKIICIGLNFAKHAKEAGAEPPKEPVIFFKATSAICGPNDDLIIPKDSKKTDWEVELAFVISEKARYVDENKALNHVAGYLLHNDYSEREHQLEKGGQWVKGKSADTFAPLGPFLVTPDEIDDVNNLNMWLKVNGEIRQQESTNDLIFKVPLLISYLSNFMTLLPGDIISTGTPSGVALGMSEPKYLVAGDIVELGIDELGSSKQKVVGYKK